MLVANRKLQVFLSYAQEDYKIVHEIYDRLKSEGWIEPWQDKPEIYLGETWPVAIKRAINSADAIVIFLSENSINKEGFVHFEMSHAYNLSLQKPPGVIFLIPIRLDNCDVPQDFYELDSKQWGDYFGEKKEETYIRLLMALNVRLNQRDKERARKEEIERQKSKEKEERERKAAEERARIAAEEKASKDKEERERKEAQEKVRLIAEEKARKEKEERERKEAEERARIATEEKARKDKEEQQRKETEEKARIAAEENARKERESQEQKNQLKTEKRIPKENEGAWLDIESYSYSDKGRQKSNKDFLAYFEPTDPVELKDYGSLYIAADGIAELPMSDRASKYAAEKILYEYYQPVEIVEPIEHLRKILEQINKEIYDYASQKNTRMITSLVVAVVRDRFLYLVSVGNCRAYLISDRRAIQISRDHTLSGELVERGEMTESDAMASSLKDQLTNTLGSKPDVIVEAYYPLTLKSGDRILLCTDGLTRYALKEQIASLTSIGTAEEIAKRLVKFSNDNGGIDSTSVIVVSYKGRKAKEERKGITAQKIEDEIVHSVQEIDNTKKTRDNVLRKNKISLGIGLTLLLGGSFTLL